MGGRAFAYCVATSFALTAGDSLSRKIIDDLFSRGEGPDPDDEEEVDENGVKIETLDDDTPIEGASGSRASGSRVFTRVCLQRRSSATGPVRGSTAIDWRPARARWTR